MENHHFVEENITALLYYVWQAAWDRKSVEIIHCVEIFVA